MNRLAEQLWTQLATVAVLGLLGLGLAALAKRGRYPRLPEPDPEQLDTRFDRRRYYLANGLALVVGAVFGAALWATPPLAEDGVVWRQSIYDHPLGRLLGPFFLMLSAGGWFLPGIADRLVAPGPLLHILWRSSAKQFAAGLDLRPALRWLSLSVGTCAVLLHLGMRNEHTTFDGAGVRWRDWPWQEELAHPWADLREIRLVRTFTALSGKVVERPHLSLQFQGGDALRIGKSTTRPAAHWEVVAALASARSGVAVQRVEHE